MKTEAHPLEIPQEIAELRLYGLGGFAVLPELFNKNDLAMLREEATSVRPTGKRSYADISDRTEERGGAPGRSFRSASGLQTQLRIFSSETVIDSLVDTLGGAVRLAGSGSFTYYEEPGDYLELHRDIVTCDLAVITCLDETSTTSEGGKLLAYPEFRGEPLADVRASGRAGATPINLRPGETVVMLGGIVPHEVTPMMPGQERIVSVMCYRVDLMM
jgi:hypothetical protein